MSEIHPVLDHAIVNIGTDLDLALDTYARLGFTLTPRGYHTLGSVNHLAIFSENYLELLGYEAPEKRPDLAKQPRGLYGLVFKAKDAALVFETLEAKGLATQEPKDFTRPVRFSGGERDAGFRTVSLPADKIQNARSFFCQHLTPELVWREEWQSHPNGANDIVGFVIVTNEPARASALFKNTFQPQSMSEELDGICTLNSGKAKIHWMPPSAIHARFGPTLLTDFDGNDQCLALVLKTTSLAKVRGALDKGNIQPTDGGCFVYVHKSQAMGASIIFIEGENLLQSL